MNEQLLCLLILFPLIYASFHCDSQLDQYFTSPGRVAVGIWSSCESQALMTQLRRVAGHESKM